MFKAVVMFDFFSTLTTTARLSLGGRFRWVGALLIGASLAGCGGGGESSPTAANTQGDPATEVASADEAIQPDPEIGRQMFLHACATCHGTAAQGLPHQGADLRASKFIAQRTDDQLLAFLQTGRSKEETTNPDGVLMPARGGNAALDDDRLRDVISFLRQVQSESGLTESEPEPVSAPPVAKASSM